MKIRDFAAVVLGAIVSPKVRLVLKIAYEARGIPWHQGLVAAGILIALCFMEHRQVVPNAKAIELSAATAAGANGTTNALNAKDSAFGAICDGGSHPLSARFGTGSSGLTAAQAVYPFITSVSQQQDYAALKLMSNTALGPDGAEHGNGGIPPGSPGATLNRPMYIPNGHCILGSDTWRIQNASGMSLMGAGSTATIIESNNIAMQFDGLWYSVIGYMEIITQGGLVALDLDGRTAGTTFGIQANIYPGLLVIQNGVVPPVVDGSGNCTSGSCFALSVCRIGQGSCQGDGQQFINLHTQGGQQAAYAQFGANTLNNSLFGGDIQSFPRNGIELHSGSLKIYTLSFESTYGYTQIANGGCDIQASQAGVNDSIVVIGSRTESLCFYNGAFSQWAEILGANQNPAAAGSWIAQTLYPTNITGVQGVDANGVYHFELPTSAVAESNTGHFASGSWVATGAQLPAGFNQIAGEVWSRVNANVGLTGSNLIATKTNGDQIISPGYGGTNITANSYWENVANGQSINFGIGIGNTLSLTADGEWLGHLSDTIGYFPNGKVWNAGALVATLQPYAMGANVGVAYNPTSHLIWFSACPNRTTCPWNNSSTAAPGSPGTGGLTVPSAVYANPVVPAFSMYLLTTGSTGLTQPTWPTTTGATVTDGTITWTATVLPAVTIAEGNMDLRSSHFAPAAQIILGQQVNVTSCGTGPTVLPNSTRWSGTVQEGSGATGCTITLHHWAQVRPNCTVSSSTSGATPFTYLVNTTPVTGDYELVITNSGPNTFTWNCPQ